MDADEPGADHLPALGVELAEAPIGEPPRHEVDLVPALLALVAPPAPTVGRQTDGATSAISELRAAGRALEAQLPGPREPELHGRVSDGASRVLDPVHRVPR